MLLYTGALETGKVGGGTTRGRTVISVVMPVHNAAPTLAAAVDSLVRQTEPELWLEKLAEPLLVWNDSPTRLSRSDLRQVAFYRLKARYLARWLAAHNPHHPVVILWGAGRITRKRAQHLVDQGISVEAFIDIDPFKVAAPDRRPSRSLTSPTTIARHVVRRVVRRQLGCARADRGQPPGRRVPSRH